METTETIKESARIRAGHSRGFAPCESGLLFVLDPTYLRSLLKDPGVMDDLILASLAAFSRGNHEVALGTGGGQAVALYIHGRGKHVLVREDEAGITIDPNVRDAA
jgi:hypothetical protein